jgi:hypothetical protein
MMNLKTSSPLESNQQLERTLLEQGMSLSEIHHVTPILMQLAEWQAPIPTPADTQRLIHQLLPYLPTISPVRRAFRARQKNIWSDFIQILQVARAQVSILRPSFWLLSAAVVFLGLGILVNTENAKHELILLALGPLLSYLGAVSIFRGAGLNVIEFELACPPSMRQLTLARLVIVLGYDLILGMLLSILLLTHGEEGLITLTLHWLAPLLWVAGSALLLSLRIPVHRAAGVAYGGWLMVLLLIWLMQDTGGIGTTFTSFNEFILSLLGVFCLALAIRFSNVATPRLLRQRP